MADILFICGECSKRLAVGTQGVGMTFACTECGAPVTVPAVDAWFSCPNCRAQLAAPEELAGMTVACPECDEEIVIELAEDAGSVPEQASAGTAPESASETLREEPGHRRRGIPTVAVTAGVAAAVILAFGLGRLMPRGRKPTEAPPPNEPVQARSVAERAAGPRPSAGRPLPSPRRPAEAPSKADRKLAPAGPVSEPRQGAALGFGTDRNAVTELPPVAPGQVKRLRDTYERDVAGVREAYGALDSEALRGYEESLLKLQKEYERSGNLKEWLAARIERDRVGDGPVKTRIPPATDVQPVLALHKGFLERLAGNDEKAVSEISALSDTYLAELNRLSLRLRDPDQTALKREIAADMERARSKRAEP